MPSQYAIIVFFELEENKMAWKNLKHRSLADDLMVNHVALEKSDDVSSLIDWNRFESMLSRIHSKRYGEKAWPPIMMFKVLLLQSWCDLSDPALENN